MIESSEHDKLQRMIDFTLEGSNPKGSKPKTLLGLTVENAQSLVKEFNDLKMIFDLKSEKSRLQNRVLEMQDRVLQKSQELLNKIKIEQDKKFKIS